MPWKKCGSRNLSPEMPTWKLDVDTLKIFLNQEAIKRKPCFRRPTLIQYFLLDLRSRFSSRRFPPAYFLYPMCLHKRAICYAFPGVSVLLVCFHNVLPLHLTSWPQFLKKCQFGNSTHVLSRQLYKSHIFKLSFLA